MKQGVKMNKKILTLAVLFSFVITGLAFATQIPQAVDPKNAATVWTEQVYNGSGSAIATGVVVEWDHDTADPSGTFFDDMAPYVKIVGTDESVWTAGVTLTDGAIANGEVGTIIIWGPAVVDNGTNVIVAGQIVGSDNAGKVQDWTGGADNEKMLGVGIKAGARIPSFSIIFIDPTLDDD